jgi:hypothetical protein
MVKRWSALTACIIATIAWLLVGCSGGGDSDGGVKPIPECAGAITVTVTGDTMPTFSWSPDCTLGRLIVEEGAEERWGTETPGNNSYQSPIVYGINPPGSALEEPAAPLFFGHTYTVTVYRWITYTPIESLQVLDVQTFTP